MDAKMLYLLVAVLSPSPTHTYTQHAKSSQLVFCGKICLNIPQGHHLTSGHWHKFRVPTLKLCQTHYETVLGHTLNRSIGLW